MSRIHCTALNKIQILPPLRALSGRAQCLEYLDPPSGRGVGLQAQLEVATHKEWGLKIYRCTYKDSRAWDRFMEILNARARLSLEREGTPELMDTLNWSVEDDIKILDGASKDVVRHRFKTWRAETISWPPPRYCDELNPRYRFCLHVDEASLYSVVEQAPQPPEPDIEGMDGSGAGGIGYVNVVDADWSLEDMREEGDEGEDPELEGHYTENVGWMKGLVYTLVPDTYSQMWELGEMYWDEVYRRLPEVICCR